VGAASILLFPEAIVRLYTDDLVIAPLAVSLLFYAAIFQYPDGLQIVAAGALRGFKDTRRPVIYMVGYHLTFTREMGPAGMWIGMIAGLSVAAVLLLRRFNHTSRRFLL
jgi:MATE family multidrug resistance protein